MKVSVIITTYNREHLVTEAIESVLAQTYQDFELIVVDDGSSDATAERLATYNQSIRYIYQKNSGLNHARNQALTLANGEYICILDDDDIWQPYKLAIQTKIMDQYPELAFTFSNFFIFKNKDSIQSNGIQSWFNRTVNWSTFFDHSILMSDLSTENNNLLPQLTPLYFGNIYHACLSHYYVLPSTAMFRRCMISEDIKFIEHDPICGDWDFFARLSRDNPVAFLDHETVFNRSHEDEFRLTRTPWKTQLEFRIDLLERLYLQDETFCNKYRDDINSVYRSRLLALCRQYILDNNQDLLQDLLIKYRRHFSSYEPGYVFSFLASRVPGLRLLIRGLRQLRG